VVDGLLPRYVELCTLLDVNAVRAHLAEDPVGAHRTFARELVRMYHGDAPVADAEARYDAVARGETPEAMREVVVPADAFEGGTIGVLRLAVLAGLAGSNGEARRLIQNRGLRLAGVVLEDPRMMVDLAEPTVMQRGKDTFVRVMR